MSAKRTGRVTYRREAFNPHMGRPKGSKSPPRRIPAPGKDSFYALMSIPTRPLPDWMQDPSLLPRRPPT
jgi:hypothetical protein